MVYRGRNILANFKIRAKAWFKNKELAVEGWLLELFELLDPVALKSVVTKPAACTNAVGDIRENCLQVATVPLKPLASAPAVTSPEAKPNPCIRFRRAHVE